MPNYSAPPLDHVFQCLADPTRRAVLARLSAGPAPVGELAKPFGMKLPSFVQHLDVLQRAGLVTSAKVGRVRTYRLAPKPLQSAEGWLVKQREVWERRLDQLDSYLMDMKEESER